MNKRTRYSYALLTTVLLLTGCGKRKSADLIVPAETNDTEITVFSDVSYSESTVRAADDDFLPEDTRCDDKVCVAKYLNEYDHLPSNYMTKDEARSYGWTGGALHLVVEGMCIGGDEYSNFEGTLPEEDEYHECDIDTLQSQKRGAKRIVYSEDGDIWYTDDHYETFELLYEDGVKK